MAAAARHEEAPLISSRVWLVAVLAMTAVLIAVWAVLWLTGVRTAYVDSGSMGRTAPVGSLIVTVSRSAPLQVGQIVSFQPPGTGQSEHSHRVQTVRADGSFTTRGDANTASDPWILHPDQVTGVVVAIIPAGGYVLRILGICAVGGIFLAVIARLIPDRRLRAVLWIGGSGVALAAAIAIVRPVGGFQLVADSAIPGRTTATVASTSVLPETVTLQHGNSTTLSYGELGTVHALHAPTGRILLNSGIELPWWGWCLLIAACAIPLLISLLIAFRPDDEHPALVTA